MANSPANAKQLAMLAIQSAYPGKDADDVVELTLSGMVEMVERAIGLGMEATREGGSGEADPMPLLYANADAANALWLAVTHAATGLRTVAMELSERCSADDDKEGYAALLHVLVGHMRGAADAFEDAHTNTYHFPSSFKRPEVAHA